MNEIAPWVFVIDTDKYAGNFERETVAYMTGRIGECEVGKECAEKYRAAGLKEDDYVIDQPDDHGCMRPASIYPNPEWWNDGDGNHERYDRKKPDGEAWPAYYSVAAWLGERPPPETLKLWAARAREFAADPQACGARKFCPSFNVTGVRLVEQKIITTDYAIE